MTTVSKTALPVLLVFFVISCSSKGEPGASGGGGSTSSGQGPSTGSTSSGGAGGALPIPTPPLISGTTTIKGNVYTSQATGEAGQKVYLTALDGPPEIQSRYHSIIAGYYPAQGSLNAAAARALQDQFATGLTYNVDGDPLSKLFAETQFTARSIYDLTGQVSTKNGGVWLTITGYTSGDTFQYPAHMFDPDVALAPPSKPPLVMKVGSLTLTFIYVAPGKFLMGEPYYMNPSWQEDPPHLVTLTKGYYLAEIPITWELYQAATGVDLRTGGEDPEAAANLSCANLYTFAKALAASSGKTVRPPTSAELVYAFRAGTSNPPFAQKYGGPNIVSGETAKVKATPPNAWGFYEWMTDKGWERSGDSPVSEHHDVTDPNYTPPEDLSDPTKPHQHAGYGRSEYPIGELEYIDNTAVPVDTYPNLMRERVLIEE
jgi:formylglycine-generating enzyme required for sulfatase activity